MAAQLRKEPKMIREKGTRFDINDRKHIDVLYNRTRTRADSLVAFMQYELGFGGRVTSVNTGPDGLITVVVRTHVFNKVDDTYFTGTSDEMEPFIQVASICGSIHNDAVDVMAGPIVEITKGVPLLITSMGHILLGRGKLFAAVAIILGIEDEEKLKKVAALGVADLCQLFAMSLDEPEAVDILLA